MNKDNLKKFRCEARYLVHSIEFTVLAKDMPEAYSRAMIEAKITFKPKDLTPSISVSEITEIEGLGDIPHWSPTDVEGKVKKMKAGYGIAYGKTGR